MAIMYFGSFIGELKSFDVLYTIENARISRLLEYIKLYLNVICRKIVRLYRFTASSFRKEMVIV